MRNFCAKYAYIVILQFVFVAAGLANTLTLGEQGEVFAETDWKCCRGQNAQR